MTFHLFILFWAVLGLCCGTGFALVVVHGGTLSLRGLLSLQSRVLGHVGLSSCVMRGTWAPRL